VSRLVCLLLSIILICTNNVIDFSDCVWGILDTIVDTDFPDIHCMSTFHSMNGTSFLISHEDDGVRVYIRLGGKEYIDPKTRRVDKEKMDPVKIFEVCVFSLSYT
jgi:phenol 2-monooxygenase (NADPH)